VNQIVNLSMSTGKGKETLWCGSGKFPMHAQVHYYKCLYHVMVFSTFLISPLSGAIQRWGIPVETTRKPYSSCQGECD
jgi:hypothetical protein